MKAFQLIIIGFFFLGFTPENPVRIFLIGDSTVADKPLIDNPEHGWGQMLPIFFSKNVTVYNHARNGRSTRSFLFEGRWDVVRTSLRAGDYVFIQFGHNDSKKEDTSRYAPPQTDYRNNLLRFVRETREAKAIPVLITPVNRRNFNPDGSLNDKHGEYPSVVRDVAQMEHVPLIDLHAKSKVMLEQLGDENSKKLFLWIKPNQYAALPKGKEDNTHFTRSGAVEIARLVVAGIRETGLSLAKEIVQPVPPMLPGDGLVVSLDEYYNNEWKQISDTQRVRYHYVWTDTTNSGFSELGRIFDRAGADLDTLQSAPTESALRKFSIYIIVDPDTPLESAHPNYLDSSAIEAIAQWVHAGGMLVMMGNDKGNAEFAHFNELAGRFGIHFNEDLHQDVKNNQYDSGRVTEFSRHPLFKNVRSIFIKQLSSLTSTSPANEILRSRGVTIMAEASFGRGKVFAVGDPWLYNEYIDNRRLPSGYENYAAAESFVHWLCTNAPKVR